MKILIDNGHGINTPGKRSPDGSLLEYKWARIVAKKIVEGLKADGFDAELLTPEEGDIKLSERVRRANEKVALIGSKNVVLVSIHINAASCDKKWHDANGWSVFVSANASIKSKALCNYLFIEASKLGRKMRRPSQYQNYWIQSLAMTRDTLCPAVLTENFFMDNADDCNWLKSDEGQTACAKLHIDALERYAREYGKI